MNGHMWNVEVPKAAGLGKPALRKTSVPCVGRDAYIAPLAGTFEKADT